MLFRGLARRTLTSLVTLALASLATISAAGCGEKERPPPALSQGDAGSRNNLGTGGRDSASSGGSGNGGSGNGSGGEDSKVEPGAPTVSVLEPEEDEVLNEALVAVCKIVQDDSEASAPLDPASVRVQLVDQKKLVAVDMAGVAGGVDEYGAELDLTQVPSGLYLLRCTASDSGAPPKSATTDVNVLVDHGPSIEPLFPLPDSFLSEVGAHEFAFQIVPDELFDGDEDAELDGAPILSVAHHDFELVPKPSEPDVYWAEAIDFEDEAIFSVPPTGTTNVTVTARNKRGTDVRLSYSTAVDAVGPVITIVSPTDGYIVGSRTTFVFEVQDDFSGVDWSTLVVDAKDNEIPFDDASSRWTQSGDTAQLELETEELSVATQLSINVTVKDKAGNATLNPAESTYYLDQKPPWFSLDPPNIRVLTTVSSVDECSYSFDPVGAAVNHGDDTNNLALFRALAWDQTNTELSQLNLHYSTVDTSSIRLWLAPAGEPLAIDTDGDAICDDVASTRADVHTVDLGAVPPAGAPFFGDGGGDDPVPVMSGLCGYAVTPQSQPAALCEGDSDLTYVVGQKLSSGPIPAVYSALISTGPGCTGDQQSVSALMGAYQGWVCAVVRGQDAAGNQSVSPPLALCLDNSEVAGTPDCLGLGAASAPDCTDGCSVDTFPAGGMVVELN